MSKNAGVPTAVAYIMDLFLNVNSPFRLKTQFALSNHISCNYARKQPKNDEGNDNNNRSRVNLGLE